MSAYEAEIVVATAALEVGYDDPAVGVVLQHKAPRDMAQFLQRKGRAGRTRHVRPWTIMVLSDYGRDRLAYQAYEQFFYLNCRHVNCRLPTATSVACRQLMRLFDDLGVDMQGGEPKGSVWRDLAQPQDYRFERWSEAAINAVKSSRPNFPLTSGDWSSCSASGADAPGSYKWDGNNWLQSTSVVAIWCHDSPNCSVNQPALRGWADTYRSRWRCPRETSTCCSGTIPSPFDRRSQPCRRRCGDSQPTGARTANRRRIA